MTNMKSMKDYEIEILNGNETRSSVINQSPQHDCTLMKKINDKIFSNFKTRPQSLTTQKIIYFQIFIVVVQFLLVSFNFLQNHVVKSELNSLILKTQSLTDEYNKLLNTNKIINNNNDNSAKNKKVGNLFIYLITFHIDSCQFCVIKEIYKRQIFDLRKQGSSHTANYSCSGFMRLFARLILHFTERKLVFLIKNII